MNYRRLKEKPNPAALSYADQKFVANQMQPDTLGSTRLVKVIGSHGFPSVALRENMFREAFGANGAVFLLTHSKKPVRSSGHCIGACIIRRRARWGHGRGEAPQEGARRLVCPPGENARRSQRNQKISSRPLRGSDLRFS